MNDKKLHLLIEDILEKTSTLNLSEVLPKAITLAKQIDDKVFEKWILLESIGYFEKNPAITEDVVTPDYRMIPGQYHDKQGRPLVLADPDFAYLNNYPIREGVAELEKISQHDGTISFRNPTVIQTYKEELGLDVDTFTYSPMSVIPVLDEIRNQLITWLVNKQRKFQN